MVMVRRTMIKKIEGKVAGTVSKRKEFFSPLKSENDEQLILTIEGNENKLAFSVSSKIASEIINILSELEQGKSIMIMADEDEITTIEAADLLHVSHPYLMKLLEKEEIPYYLVGGYRRMKAGDVLNYKQKIDQLREEALDELTAQAQELDMGY